MTDDCKSCFEDAKKAVEQSEFSRLMATEFEAMLDRKLGTANKMQEIVTELDRQNIPLIIKNRRVYLAPLLGVSAFLIIICIGFVKLLTFFTHAR